MSLNTKLLISLVVISVIVLSVADAQSKPKKPTGTGKKKLPVKRGPDGRPLLFGPKIELCQNRK